MLHNLNNNPNNFTNFNNLINLINFNSSITNDVEHQAKAFNRYSDGKLQ